MRATLRLQSGCPVHGGTFVTLAGAGFTSFDSGCAADGGNATNATSADDADDAGSGDVGGDEQGSGEAAGTTGGGGGGGGGGGSTTAVACNVTAPANRTQPRCKFTFGDAATPATVYGSAAHGGDGGLVCQAPQAPHSGYAPVLVSLNGIDYTEFPSMSSVVGIYAVNYYHPAFLSAIEPPGGPVSGGTLIRLMGSGLASFGQEFPLHDGRPTPELVPVTSMGSDNGGGYVMNRVVRGELNITRGVRYRLEVVAIDNPFCLTLSRLGGALAPALLITTGPNVNPIEYGEMSFVADASLPSSFYYQSTIFQWSTQDPAIQRINLFDPRGVSTLRFGDTVGHPLGTLRSRNASMIQATAPAQAVGTQAVAVVFSPNSAEEDYLSLGHGLGDLPYTYHDEVTFETVVPAGSPIYGGTNLTLVGSGFDQAVEVLTDDRLRCLFDPDDNQPEVLPQATGVHFRNATHVVCPTPPSWLGRPPYLMHGTPLRLVNRTVKLRLALNGYTGSLASVHVQYYSNPNVSSLLPASGPVYGGTHVAIYGEGLAVYDSPLGSAVCRFDRAESPLLVVNDTTALCVSPPVTDLAQTPEGGLVSVQVALNGVDFGTDASQTVTFEYYRPPVLESVWPLGGAAEGGTVVTIRGTSLELAHGTYPAPRTPGAPKLLFGDVGEVGWVENRTSHGTTIPDPYESNATKWVFLERYSAREVVCILPELYGGYPGTPRLQGLAFALNGQQFEPVSLTTVGQ